MSIARFSIWILVLALVPPQAWSGHEDEPRTLDILGWVENAHLVAPEIDLRAKLDTGANTSSLDVRIIKRFRQWGRRWVRFAVTDPESGEEIVMVRERERTIGIVQHEGDSDVRPTVKVEICIAGRQLEIEVSLTDRRNFNYPLLLGRRALQKFAIVDSSDTFVAEQVCPDEVDRSGLVLDPSATNPDRSRAKDAESGQISDDEDRAEDVVLEDDDSDQGGS
ncbi:putative ATP-dependent zinc protease [Halomonas denitrificans]|nr:RimK/LysX family protein [Halomonas denitrificans]